MASAFTTGASVMNSRGSAVGLWAGLRRGWWRGREAQALWKGLHPGGGFYANSQLLTCSTVSCIAGEQLLERL